VDRAGTGQVGVATLLLPLHPQVVRRCSIRRYRLRLGSAAFFVGQLV